MYIAHRDAETGREQSISDHLAQTAELAAEFARVFGAEESARFCARVHDIGKYSAAFQQRIRGAAVRVDHATAGAQVAMEYGDPISAVCIAGHHTGLPDFGGRGSEADETTLRGRMKRALADYSAYTSEVTITRDDVPRMPMLTIDKAFFFTHMLFSCLVDADWLDTEAFFNAAKRDMTVSDFPVLMKNLEQYISGWWNPQTELNRRRCTILRAALDSGQEQSGLFRLTVPTGGGKTIASMAFALRHLLAHDKRRIIYVIPYVSILEQTQKVFEEVFGAENVLAHYANVDFGDGSDGSDGEAEKAEKAEKAERGKRRLATENWDAPIILTTSVQFFESLFANKPARCRKLHNIAQSIVIFDEVQMLPIPYLKPCLWSISQLVADYDCSAILCTATQPALDALLQSYLPEAAVREICPDVKDMYDFFRRVRYQHEGKLSPEALAEQLGAEEQVLCIVNSRKQARELFDLLVPDGSFYLTTTMLPRHRRAVLEKVRERLKAGKTCRVVATSLIEAGVDVDFPVVWREIAGLDSIIQAGGRCNREGKRAQSESTVHIFEAEKAPPSIFAQNIAASRQILSSFADISAPEAIYDYFDFLYYILKGDDALDGKGIMEDIREGTMPFQTIAQNFQIIENGQCTVYIPYDDTAEELIAQLRASGPTRTLMRRLGQYAVSVYPDQFLDFYRTGAVDLIAEDAADKVA